MRRRERSAMRKGYSSFLSFVCCLETIAIVWFPQQATEQQLQQETTDPREQLQV